ncbi:MAG: D-aminoacylase [Gemmatimonadota bacterium]
MRRTNALLAILLLTACTAESGAPPAATPMGSAEPAAAGAYDLILSGGKIVDGTGAAWFYGDLGIRADRIAAITPAGVLAGATAGTRIDATGMVVSPGFIDIQSHSRGAFLTGDGRVLGKITQGITTEIMGEGWTNAPENERTRAAADAIDPEAAAAGLDFSGEHGFDAWLRAMESHGTSPNVGSFVGASTIRIYGKGMDAGPANAEELEQMKTAVRHAMEDGAFGVASALIYPPGNYASTDELVEIVSASAPYGGVYITHMRSEADRYLEAIDEAMEIGKRAGVPVEIYHLKAAGRRNFSKGPQAVAKIDSARAAGLDVQANMYPYIAGGTGLAALLPPWASEGGRLLENLQDPATRKRIHDEVIGDNVEWENLGALATPGGVLVVEAPGAEQHVGKRLSEVAAELGGDWVDAAIELTIATKGQAGMVVFMMSEPNLALQMKQPWIKFGTDAGGMDPDSVTSMAHPRSYGTFPRILGRYVRDARVFPLEDAIRKMSSAVATRLSLGDRGVLREGMMADIVVFDPETVLDVATFEQPHQLSVGIRDVFVNGVAVVRDGEHTGAKPGRVVRGPGWRP